MNSFRFSAALALALAVSARAAGAGFSAEKSAHGVVVKYDGQPFAGAPVILTRQLGDVTVGFFGLITPSTAVSSSPGGDVHFTDPVAAAKTAVDALRHQGAQVVVALTHLDLADDRELLRAVPGITLILGGHDHDPIAWLENGALILKAGHDGQYLSAVDLAVRTPPAGPR